MARTGGCELACRAAAGETKRVRTAFPRIRISVTVAQASVPHADVVELVDTQDLKS